MLITFLFSDSAYCAVTTYSNTMLSSPFVCKVVDGLRTDCGRSSPQQTIWMAPWIKSMRNNRFFIRNNFDGRWTYVRTINEHVLMSACDIRRCRKLSTIHMQLFKFLHVPLLPSCNKHEFPSVKITKFSSFVRFEYDRRTHRIDYIVGPQQCWSNRIELTHWQCDAWLYKLQIQFFLSLYLSLALSILRSTILQFVDLSHKKSGLSLRVRVTHTPYYIVLVDDRRLLRIMNSLNNQFRVYLHFIFAVSHTQSHTHSLIHCVHPWTDRNVKRLIPARQYAHNRLSLVQYIVNNLVDCRNLQHYLGFTLYNWCDRRPRVHGIGHTAMTTTTRLALTMIVVVVVNKLYLPDSRNSVS